MSDNGHRAVHKAVQEMSEELQEGGRSDSASTALPSWPGWAPLLLFVSRKVH